jgi:hypothetical protein
MQDPLSFEIDMTETSTDMPRFPKGEYLFAIKEAKIEPNKAQTGHNLLVIFASREATKSHTGDPISPGYTVRKYYPLQQSDNENAPDFKRDIAILLDAAFGVKNPADRPKLNTETISALVQRPVVLALSLKDSDDFGLQNEIRSVKPVE